jgi:hypothetical protein
MLEYYFRFEFANPLDEFPRLITQVRLENIYFADVSKQNLSVSHFHSVKGKYADYKIVAAPERR